jgi:hypothetical protein
VLDTYFSETGKATPKRYAACNHVVASQLGEFSGPVDDSVEELELRRAVRWLRHQTVPVIPIIGARKVTQLQDNLGSLDLELSAEQLKSLDGASQTELGFPQSILRERNGSCDQVWRRVGPARALGFDFLTRQCQNQIKKSTFLALVKKCDRSTTCEAEELECLCVSRQLRWICGI